VASRQQGRRRLAALTGWLAAPACCPRAQLALESRRLGVPGVVNFVDARTRWFDQAVKDATCGSAGIKQVGGGCRMSGRRPGLAPALAELMHGAAAATVTYGY
jgi:hypothetical protein